MKALTVILKVKSGATNDLALNELCRAQIASNLLDRQFKFYNKISVMKDGEGIVTEMLNLCKGDRFIQYYSTLQSNNCKEDIRRRTARIRDSCSSMTKYYVDMQFNIHSCIYNSFINDTDRGIITRWRLSNHDLKIETGRYSGLPREERVCELCLILEDEFHVVFECPLYEEVREKHREFLARNKTIASILNPNITGIHETSEILHQIEIIRKK